MIAKLLTEDPTPLRLLRSTVSRGVEAAVARALARVPADRRASAGAFAAALAEQEHPGRWSVPRRRWIIGTAAVTLLVVGAVVAASRLRPHPAPAPVAPALTQLTSTGRATQPLFSPDGSQIAYVAEECSELGECSRTVVLRESGEEVERAITAPTRGQLFLHSWSPDGLRLLYTVFDTADQISSYVVSRLGATPQRVGDWWSGGFAGSSDTLLVTRYASDTTKPGVCLRQDAYCG